MAERYRYSYTLELIYANKIIPQVIMSNIGTLDIEAIKRRLDVTYLSGLIDIKINTIHDCDNRSYSVFNEK